MKLRSVLAVVLLLAAALTSCAANEAADIRREGPADSSDEPGGGGGGGGDDPTDRPTGNRSRLSVAAAATSGDTFHFTIEGSVDSDLAIEMGGVSGEGDRDGDRSRFTMDVPTIAGAGFSPTMEMVIDGDRQFLRYDGMPVGSPFPDGWIEITGQDAGSAVVNTASIDALLDQFQADGSEVDDLGEVEDNGVTVQRYATTLDLSASYEGIEIENRAMEQMLSTMAETMSAVEAIIDVDEDDHIVRIAYDVETAAGISSSEMRLSEFGEPVDIEVPEADVTMTLDEFAELSFPSSEPYDGPEIDDEDLIDRDLFVGLMEESGLPASVGECVYDELAATRPDILTMDGLAGMSEPTGDAQDAIIAAGMACAGAN